MSQNFQMVLRTVALISRRPRRLRRSGRFLVGLLLLVLDLVVHCCLVWVGLSFFVSFLLINFVAYLTTLVVAV